MREGLTTLLSETSVFETDLSGFALMYRHELYFASVCAATTWCCAMSIVSQLQIAQREIQQAFGTNATISKGEDLVPSTTSRCQQRAQRWGDNTTFSSLCASLGSHITLAQSCTQERVFARQVSCESHT